MMGGNLHVRYGFCLFSCSLRQLADHFPSQGSSRDDPTRDFNKEWKRTSACDGNPDLREQTRQFVQNCSDTDYGEIHRTTFSIFEICSPLLHCRLRKDQLSQQLAWPEIGMMHTIVDKEVLKRNGPFPAGVY